MSIDDAYEFLLALAGDDAESRRDVFDAYVEVKGRLALLMPEPRRSWWRILAGRLVRDIGERWR